MMIIT